MSIFYVFRGLSVKLSFLIISYMLKYLFTVSGVEDLAPLAYGFPPLSVTTLVFQSFKKPFSQLLLRAFLVSFLSMPKAYS